MIKPTTSGGTRVGGPCRSVTAVNDGMVKDATPPGSASTELMNASEGWASGRQDNQEARTDESLTRGTRNIWA